jgi:hypothetical protein
MRTVDYLQFSYQLQCVTLNVQGQSRGNGPDVTVYNVFYLNPGQPRTLLQLKLVGILTINLFLTYYTTTIIKTKIHPLNYLVF